MLYLGGFIMARIKKVWHPLFKDYMDMIIKHPNYEGLRIDFKADGSPIWLAPKQTYIGKERIEWAKKKAKMFGIKDEPGVFAKVMLEVHPTKRKVCQTCGKTMSLYYLYPNVSLVNSIKKQFDFDTDSITSLIDIVEDLSIDYSDSEIKKFLETKFGVETEEQESLVSIVWKCENKSRLGNSKMLGPGAMSNFPDRFDGFHSYNRCCRSIEDKGRSSENLRSYTKDRRAYEYWSDGNIHAANQYMGSSFFLGASADHIGPISLGFVHDSLFLRRMPSGDNSSKRDRLLYDDIEEIIAIEEKHHITAISWYSSIIWKHIKDNYKSKKEKIEEYRLLLKTQMNNFMYILWFLLERSPNDAESFLITAFLSSKFEYFKYNYEFGEDGLATKMVERNVTDATRKEVGRFVRIAVRSVFEYNEKENRNTKSNFSKEELERLWKIGDMIMMHETDFEIKGEILSLVNQIQKRLVQE
jgi:Alw26I/Eco31I/Esp3I family type II restriction endonuclease